MQWQDLINILVVVNFMNIILIMVRISNLKQDIIRVEAITDSFYKLTKEHVKSLQIGYARNLEVMDQKTREMEIKANYMVETFRKLEKGEKDGL